MSYYPVSTAFERVIRQSGKRKTVADIYEAGQIVAVDVPIVGGSINIDRKSGSRRAGSIVLGDPNFVPVAESETPLEPYALEISIRSGVIFPNDIEELVPYGVFRIESIEWDEGPEAIPTLVLYDRFYAIEHNIVSRWPIDYSGWRIHEAIEDAFHRDNPDWVINIDGSLRNPRLPGGTVLDGKSRGEGAVEWADSIGAELYFDVNGEIQVAPGPEITDTTLPGDAVWTVNTGDDAELLGVMISANRSLSRTGVYNAVRVMGVPASEHTLQPSGYADDYDPTSPTYVLGPFNFQTLKVDMPSLTTNRDCTEAAKKILSRTRSLARSVTLTCIPNPALDVGDVILIEYSNGTQELHLVDSIDFPFVDGPMSVTTRTNNAVDLPD